MGHNLYRDSNGLLTIPLYHGTSSYFLPFIAQYGLGGRNVINEWRVPDFLSDVIEACEGVEDAGFQEAMKAHAYTRDRIVGREAHKPNGFNWRYGGVYLTADRKKAVTYAIRGGSELLRIALAWHCDLKRFAPEFAAELLSHYPEVSIAATATHDPVVIEISGLRVDHLATETGLIGHALEDQLEEAFEIQARPHANIMSNCSFEYIGDPISASGLNVFDVRAKLEGYIPSEISFSPRTR
jgi:hypothetical protein